MSKRFPLRALILGLLCILVFHSAHICSAKTISDQADKLHDLL